MWPTPSLHETELSWVIAVLLECVSVVGHPPPRGPPARAPLFAKLTASRSASARREYERLTTAGSALTTPVKAASLVPISSNRTTMVPSSKSLAWNRAGAPVSVDRTRHWKTFAPWAAS